ncbi:MAG: hypothetical protein UW82_C0031G0004 [candidate division WWE3 bacterium GW2011_GWC2_44_9]|uniref:EamA domain-containing protein n=2 Tax=Katanobacteria TaxID=422282 RepID=A0A0G1KJF7_UNCKA|nr:MAG: hypothetical protein UW82_C0031G0004 [candidate division WWE3 bacterium GW2011_GWC2_44_9]OGC52535.1 MAG: hypothetical protein A2709_01500 [candidate division WWE3 bacterium RIFCSPHIGHO2_01_FULL_43_9]
MSNLPSSPKELKQYAVPAMLIATAIWGFAPPIIKHTLDYIPPMAFLFFRFLIVCLLLLPFMYLRLRREKITLREFPVLAISGLLGQTSLILVFWGLKFTTSLEVAVIGIIAPLLMVAAGHYFYGDKVNKKIKLGLLITSIGTLILAIGPILDSNSGHGLIGYRIIGNVLIVLYNLVWTAFVLWSKRLRGENSPKLNRTAKYLGICLPTKKYESSTITTVSFYVALLTMIPLYILETSGAFGNSNTYNIASIPVLAWAGLLYMAVLSSIAAYGLFEWSLKYLKVTDTAIFSYIAPLFTLPAAFLLLGELPTKGILVGAAVVVLGIAVAEKNRS